MQNQGRRLDAGDICFSGLHEEFAELQFVLYLFTYFFPNSSSHEFRFSRDCIPAIGMKFSVQNTEVTKGWFL